MKRSGWQLVVLTGAALVALIAASCTGTDFLDSGNSQVRVELAITGDTGDYDCLNFEFGQIRFRPIDGVCSPDSANPGEPCLSSTDCPNGIGIGECDGSNASDVIGDLGVLVVTADENEYGNLLGGTCESTNKTCSLPFAPQQTCAEDSDCTTTVCANNFLECATSDDCGGGSCEAYGRCNLDQFNVCLSDTDCNTIDGDECVFCRPSFAGATAGVFEPVPPLILSEGLYEINELDFSSIALYRDNPGELRACLNQSKSISSALGDALRFTVGADQDKVVQLSIDVAELEATLTNAASCFALDDTAVASIFTCETCDAGVSP